MDNMPPSSEGKARYHVKNIGSRKKADALSLTFFAYFKQKSSSPQVKHKLTSKFS